MMRKMICTVVSVMLLLALQLPIVSAEDVADTGSVEKITWEELESRIREGNLTLLALGENINSIEIVNYDSMYNTLRSQLNQLSVSQEFLVMTGQYDGVEGIAQAYASIRSTYDDIKSGKLQRSSKSAVAQLRDAQNQLVVAGQTLYVNIVYLEHSLEDGERGLEVLERTLTELRLRKKYGQVSQQVIEDTEKAKRDAESGLETLRSTIASCKSQLQMLMGREPTGELELGALPDFYIIADLEIDVEEDIITAKENSCSLDAAKIKLDEAKESYDEAEADYIAGEVPGYQRTSARYLYEAEKLNYESSVSSFEFSFGELYRSLNNCGRTLENKRDSVKYQERQLAIAEKKYELGLISYFSLLKSRDDLESAKTAAFLAEIDYFAALNKYNNAIRYGLV